MNDPFTKTLLLINPAVKTGRGFIVNKDTRYQPLSLGIIAALTPPYWKVKIMDENFREFKYYPADLVGFTAFTSTVPRAYELAAVYREKGIPTVIGGIHASMRPEEAGNYVDCVVTGEAETVWPGLIEDFENGRLRQRYTGTLTSMVNSPLPRRDLLHPAYVFASVQTTRGCPMNCDFCSVTAFNGSRYRFRPVEDVIAEMKTIPQRNLFILDDNIAGHTRESEDRAVRLFKAMIESGIKKDWVGQASLKIADNEEVLKYAARSGCRMLLIGIETEREDQLAIVNKKTNLAMGPDSYDRVFTTLHKYGISSIASFIFGWEQDTRETIDNRVRFTRECKADAIQSAIMTPLPGTRLFEKIEKERRMVFNHYPEDWQFYGYQHLVFRPDFMDRQDLEDYIYRSLGKVYARSFLKWRMIKSWWRTRNFITAYWSYMSNWNYRALVFGADDKPRNWLLK